MTGRHAAPRNPAPRRAAITVGVATMTIPLSLPTLPTAAASPQMNWDRVADCESTNDWDANTGNGYSGGLQFSPSTWRAFGGTRYAPAAWQASRTEQIAIAENVLDAQGVRAWPVCGPKGVGGTTRNAGGSSASSSPAGRSGVRPSTPAGSSAGSSSVGSRSVTPAVPDQPRAVQRAVAASGPTNPACVSLKSRGISVERVEVLHRSHPELGLDGNHNNIPCDVSFPRASSGGSEGVTSRPSSTRAETAVSSSGVVATAQTWIGTPYRFGGNTRAGVDCSGLVQRVFAVSGVNLPRTARAQMAAAHRITHAQARPGDLVGNPSGSHIGIYIGDGRMIDAPHTGSHVGVRKLYRDMTVFGRIA